MHCTTKDYDKIYQPWLRNATSLLDLASYNHVEHSLLDLCGGTGAVSVTALRRRKRSQGSYEGKPVVLMDLVPRQDTHVKEKAYIDGVAQDLNEYPWPVLSQAPFDVVVCRQALGYIRSLPDFFAEVAKQTARGSLFAFNTFTKPPFIRTKSTRMDGGRYWEIGVSFFGRVLHLQKAVPSAYIPKTFWDVSCFRYHSEKKIRKALQKHWCFNVQREGSSLRFLCTPKGD